MDGKAFSRHITGLFFAGEFDRFDRVFDKRPGDNGGYSLFCDFSHRGNSGHHFRKTSESQIERPVLFYLRLLGADRDWCGINNQFVLANILQIINI